MARLFHFRTLFFNKNKRIFNKRIYFFTNKCFFISNYFYISCFCRYLNTGKPYIVLYYDYCKESLNFYLNRARGQSWGIRFGLSFKHKL